MKNSHSESYAAAGVDVTAGYEAVNRIKPLVESTYIPGVMGSLGGFGGLFALSALYSSFLTPSVAIGIALGLDGLQNAWITMHTVRVRARKKNLSEKFGLENHEEDSD